MKKHLTIITCIAIAMPLHAQEDVIRTDTRADSIVPTPQPLTSAAVIAAQPVGDMRPMVGSTMPQATTEATPTAIETVDTTRRYDYYAPTIWSAWYLHKGLNVSLDLSVFATFGKGAPHGAGFNETVSLLHVTPINDRLTLMLGGYVSNTTYKGDNNITAGLNALIDYRIDNHWSVSAFAQKAFNGSRTNNAAYYYGGMGYSPWYGGGSLYGATGYLPYDSHIADRIGAAVRYEWNNNTSIQLSVEYDRLPNQHFTAYPRQYDYPTK